MSPPSPALQLTGSYHPGAPEPTLSYPRLPVPEAGPGLRQIAGYQVTGELGRGGMGVVYKAWQVQLKRTVALKMILPGAAPDADQVARFRREAEAVARMHHPNIVQIYEIGEHEGLPFFSLEFVDGGNLASQLRRSTRPPREAAELVETLARAMEAAHQNGIIHRDLKPANVLLMADGTPKITDFGLAKKLDEGAGPTVSGAIMGTPSYMAPEQAAGKTRLIGPAADIYALCAILYEMLTGRPPFKGPSLMETLAEVVSREPVSPSQLQPKVPRDLETICLKGLRKDLRQRYASARELAEDLRRFLEGRPIRARPVPTWERAYRWVRRRPTQAALIAASVLALLAGSVGALLYGMYEKQRATALQQQWERRQNVDDYLRKGEEAEANQQLADAKEYLVQALATLEAEKGADTDELRQQIEERRARVSLHLEEQAERNRQAAQRQDCLDRRARFQKHRDEVLYHAINVSNQDAAANAACIRREAPAALTALGWNNTEPPEVIAERLKRFRERLPEPESFNQLAAGCFQVFMVWAEAEATALPADPATRQARLRQALGLLSAAAAVAQDHQLSLPQSYHQRRANYLAQLGDKAGAGSAQAQAAAASTRTALDLFLAALQAFGRNDFAGAAGACEKVLRQEPEHFWALYLHALCQLRSRQWMGAKVGLTACLGRQPDCVWARLQRGMAHAQLKEIADAEADFAQVLQQSSEPLVRWAVLAGRGVLRVQQGCWDDAVKDLQQAITVRSEAPEAYITLAQAHRGRNDLDAAVGALDQALARRPMDPNLLHSRGELHLERKDWGAACRDFMQAIAQGDDGSNPERLAGDYVRLGHLQHQEGEYRAALVQYDAALRVRPDFTPAHLERAETLLALQRHAEAGQALDAYLKAKEARSPRVYVARGLIHFQLRSYPEAVDVFSRALMLKREARTLSLRGWAYLRLQAPQLALADFKAALELESANPDALCGRGSARVRLGQVKQGVEDAEAALRQGLKENLKKPTLLYSAACLYARAAGETESRSVVPSALADQYRLRSIALFRAVLQQTPAHQRREFWQQNIQNEPDLAWLRRTRDMAALYQAFF
jgi:lipoprotein NlpI/predicted Ser/Thr protein kinase